MLLHSGAWSTQGSGAVQPLFVTTWASRTKPHFNPPGSPGSKLPINTWVSGPVRQLLFDLSSDHKSATLCSQHHFIISQLHHQPAAISTFTSKELPSTLWLVLQTLQQFVIYVPRTFLFLFPTNFSAIYN